MVINILLAIAFLISIYMLWKRISLKIPELILIPDQHISELLEENKAKLQRFFLHLFHFRSFYQKRHYHERARYVFGKFLYRVHIILLRFDNKIIEHMKRMREVASSAEAQTEKMRTASIQENRGRIDLSYMREEHDDVPVASVVLQTIQPSMPHSVSQPEIQSTQEIKPRRRARSEVSMSPVRSPRMRKSAPSEARFVENEETLQE